MQSSCPLAMRAPAHARLWFSNLAFEYLGVLWSTAGGYSKVQVREQVSILKLQFFSRKAREWTSGWNGNLKTRRIREKESASGNNKMLKVSGRIYLNGIHLSVLWSAPGLLWGEISTGPCFSIQLVLEYLHPFNVHVYTAKKNAQTNINYVSFSQKCFVPAKGGTTLKRFENHCARR